MTIGWGYRHLARADGCGKSTVLTAMNSPSDQRRGRIHAALTPVGGSAIQAAWQAPVTAVSVVILAAIPPHFTSYHMVTEYTGTPPEGLYFSFPQFSRSVCHH